MRCHDRKGEISEVGRKRVADTRKCKPNACGIVGWVRLVWLYSSFHPNTKHEVALSPPYTSPNHHTPPPCYISFSLIM